MEREYKRRRKAEYLQKILMCVGPCIIVITEE